MSLAKQVRRAREELGVTQTDMVGRLRDAGVAISRGHYANLERGAYDFTEDQITALERVLSVSLSDPDASTAPSGAPAPIVPRALTDDYVDEVVRAGRKLNEYLAEPDLGWTPESLRDQARLPRDDDPPAEVLEDSYQVERRFLGLLLAGAERPAGSQPILLLGFSGASMRYGRRIGLSKEARRAVRHALMQRQRCIHVVRTNEDDRDIRASLWVDGERREDAARFVQVVGQLLRTPGYEPFAAPARQVGTIDAAVVVPGVGAIQFYGGATSGRFEAALFLREPNTVQAVADHIRQLMVVSKPMANRRLERGPGEFLTPALDDDELMWAADVTELTEVPCPRAYAYLFFPTELWPPSVYQRRLEARRRACEDPETKGDRRWQVLRERQEVRNESLCEQLAKGVPCRVILPSSTLARFARDGRWAWATEAHTWMTWAPDERVDVLRSVIGLLDKYPNLEIATAGARWRRQLESVRWAVHDVPSGALATVRVVNRGEHACPESRVEMEIRQPEIVHALAAHFGDLWRNTWDVETDRRSVRAELEKALEQAREADAASVGAG